MPFQRCPVGLAPWVDRAVVRLPGEEQAIQGLGRTYRTSLVSAPLFRSATADVKGERRFIASIARTLDGLGTIIRGERKARLPWAALSGTPLRRRDQTDRPLRVDHYAPAVNTAVCAVAVYTLIGTTKLKDVDSYAWFANVLTRNGGIPQSQLDQLLPWNTVPAVMLYPAASAGAPQSAPHALALNFVLATPADFGGWILCCSKAV